MREEVEWSLMAPTYNTCNKLTTSCEVGNNFQGPSVHNATEVVLEYKKCLKEKSLHSE